MSSPEMAALAEFNQRYIAQVEAEGAATKAAAEEVCDYAASRRRSAYLVQLVLTTLAAAAGFWVGSVKNA